MSDQNLLTIAFLDQAPRAAAQELQRLPLAEAAALIETVPARLCAAVVDSMVPWNAARLFESVSASQAAAILRQLSFADSVTLTRLIAPDNREGLFEAMPTRYAARLRNALEYPQHQVGAWIDPEVPTLRVTDTVSDALRVLREAHAASHVFLESGDHEKFAGLIPIREIVRSDLTVTLNQLRAVDSAPVSNRASLAALAFDARWDEFLHLPVVGRRGNLLGGLSRKTLRHAIHEQHLSNSGRDRSLLRELSAALTMTAAEMTKLVSAGSSSLSKSMSGVANDDR
ncbi:MAG TPA: CBS domain-containing protein [Gammaproteobacteria bacterium]|nr:CBS domain-containing protein [Gammaproteobacteria bacterium]